MGQIKEKLEKVHKKFLESVKNIVIGEILVGSFVYAKEEKLSDKTDLDIICVVEENRFHDFLKSTYLSGILDPEICLNMIKDKKTDYIVIKVVIEEVLLSIDLILPNFFEELCNIKLNNISRTRDSYKFGNEPQLNEYPVSELSGKLHNIKKESTEISKGYLIKLPLFFIIDNHYVYGIPTVKYLTSKIFIDRDNFIHSNIASLKKQIVKRLLKEYPNEEIDIYERYYLNLLIGRNKFPRGYKEKILKETNQIITMENIIRDIKREVYSLFKEDTKERRFSYVRKDWIFPNHLDIMLDLVEEMCQKYGGDEDICKIAVLLHDVGLVYKRDSSSPEGHESRSIEYAKIILNKYNIPLEEQNKIIDCINATDASENPSSLNPKIVRTADALSQFISVHFFAKAAFSGDWDSYKDWLKKKSTNNFKKICFEEEMKRAEPIRNYILSSIELYENYSKDYPIK